MWWRASTCHLADMSTCRSVTRPTVPIIPLYANDFMAEPMSFGEEGWCAVVGSCECVWCQLPEGLRERGKLESTSEHWKIPLWGVTQQLSHNHGPYSEHYLPTAWLVKPAVFLWDSIFVRHFLIKCRFIHDLFPCLHPSVCLSVCQSVCLCMYMVTELI